MKAFLLFAGLALLLSPSIALAHSNPATAQPPINGNVSTSPNAITLTFDSPVVPDQTSLRLLDEHGKGTGNNPTTIDTKALVATLPTQPLSPGVYTVLWTNQSAEDGHENQGYYTIVVGPPEPDRQVAFGGGTERNGQAAVQLNAGDLTVALATSSAGIGPKPLDIALSDASGPVDKAFVRFRVDFGDAAAKIPEDYVVAQPTPGTPGHYGALLPVGLLGDWTLKLAISRDGKPDLMPTANLVASATSSPASISSAGSAGITSSATSSPAGGNGAAAASSPPVSPAVATPSPAATSVAAPSASTAASQSTASWPGPPVLALAAGVIVLGALITGGWLAASHRKPGAR